MLLTGPSSARPSRPARHLAARPARLGAVAALSLSLAVGGLLAAPARTFAWDAGAFSATSEEQLVGLTNQTRANAGLRALTVDPELTSIARWRSQDMIERDYFSHDIPPDGRRVFDEMWRRGYCYALAGENIGWNTYPDDVATEVIHQMFLDSPSHRANILGSAWDHVGIGAYKGPSGKKMWTVLFADKCPAGPTPTPTPSPTPTPTPTPKPTPTPTPTPIPTPTPTPVPAPTPTPSPTPTPTPTPSPTPTPTPTPTPSPTPRPTKPPKVKNPRGSAARTSLATTAPEPSPAPSAGPVLSISVAVAEPPVAGLRVSEPGGSQGFLQSVVGDVAGQFFGG